MCFGNTSSVRPPVPWVDGPEPPGADARRPRRARVPRRSGVGVGRPRSVGLRGDDERFRAAARGAGRRGAVLDSHPRGRGPLGGRDGQGALPNRGRPSGRGRADALPGRAPLDLRQLAVGLPAHLLLLRDGRDALRPQPDPRRDPRPGAPLPPDRARQPPRLHGHGRAVPQLRERARGGPQAPRPRDHPPADDDLHRRLAPEPDALRRRGRGADPARALGSRGQPGAALADHAGERPLPPSPT